MRGNPSMLPTVFARFESVSSTRLEEHGFESTTIMDILTAKGKSADGSWLWCTTDDTVYDAVKSMTQHNVGSLVVVRPEKRRHLLELLLRENKLITVTPDTKVLQAMQLMTENRIRHIPVVDKKSMIGMVSIGDVVRAVVSEHREELTFYLHGN
ncbi:CBS domain-containing protein CBSX3, mitochondrial-like [Curcuma longa]|uniref:CBS domain-containing protein CBSX3, mitochondrial-like n=1 Tax=Curcuma longa TaxID=136217 RepID=UPI003D9EA909